MDEQRSLVDRFAIGSNDISWHVPFTPQRDFFLGIPERQRHLVALAKQQVTVQKRVFGELEKQNIENNFALNEIGFQIENLADGIDHLGGRFEDTISFLEQSLVSELSEIKWVLGQLDKKLAEAIHLIKYPRNTEARELVEDGVVALSRGYFDDAQLCFKRALDKKVTDFQAHTNMGFVFLHKEDANHAIEHFRKAVDYAPESPHDETRIYAFETLARAYYATKDFVSAQKVASKAIELRETQELESDNSEYRYATYCILSGNDRAGLAIIERLCREKPQYFAISSTDPDLKRNQTELLQLLDQLAIGAYKEARGTFEEAKKFLYDLEANTKQFGDWVLPERKELQRSLSFSEQLLGCKTYSTSRQSNRISWLIQRVCGCGKHLPALRDKLRSLEENEKEAYKHFCEAKKKDEHACWSFKKKQDTTAEGGRYTLRIIGYTIAIAIMMLTVHMFWRGLIQGFWKPFNQAMEENPITGLLQGILMVIGLPIFVGFVFGGGALASWLLVTVSSKVGEFWESQALNRRWSKLPELQHAETEYNEARSTTSQVRNEVQNIETIITPRLAKLQKILQESRQ